MGQKHANSNSAMLWAFRLLQISLALLLAGAGADKIFQVSISWNQYVPPILPWLTGTNLPTFLSGIGFFELILAFGIVLAPGTVGAIVSLWLLLANLALIGSGAFHDLSLLDFALAISAFGLSSLGQIPGIASLHLTRPKRFHLVVQSYQQFHEAP